MSSPRTFSHHLCHVVTHANAASRPADQNNNGMPGAANDAREPMAGGPVAEAAVVASRRRRRRRDRGTDRSAQQPANHVRQREHGNRVEHSGAAGGSIAARGGDAEPRVVGRHSVERGIRSPRRRYPPLLERCPQTVHGHGCSYPRGGGARAQRPSTGDTARSVPQSLELAVSVATGVSMVRSGNSGSLPWPP